VFIVRFNNASKTILTLTVGHRSRIYDD